ncbi:MAG: LysR family transcriptional regulator [Betaproteobacteria bacterium HGW-Betaproteobacteria-11]|nr:MAG: LysR family transcriptional regulator [Betaproteobacteria bacterium HGW-Betaproteobacteria-11]
MSKSATSPRRSSRHQPPRLRWAWDFGTPMENINTTRLPELLAAIRDVGALGEAAAIVGMSYRAVWGLLRQCEAALGVPLVVMQRGRGSHLSALGQSIVELDREARLALGEVHAPWEHRLQDVLRPATASAFAPPLRFFASHDLALASWCEAHAEPLFDLSWHGSEEALAALAGDECDIAGFHLPETWPAAQVGLWLGRWLRPRLHQCLPLMRRQQGLLVAAGNPLGIRSLADLARRGVRLVNRQRGSGTRRLIDQLLAANGLRPEQIEGWRHEEFTHEAIAATVASGQADAGFGIEAAARKLGLDFVPLTWERYGLAFRAGLAASDAGQRLLASLQADDFRQALTGLPGYQLPPLAAPGPWESFLRNR